MGDAMGAYGCEDGSCRMAMGLRRLGASVLPWALQTHVPSMHCGVYNPYICPVPMYVPDLGVKMGCSGCLGKSAVGQQTMGGKRHRLHLPVSCP